MKPAPNAICFGGPRDGMLTRIHQDVGIVQVAVELPGGSLSIAYRITSGRVHHPSSDVPFTVLIWAAAVTMVFLGRWQLHVSDAKHFDLQNFSYVIQWWAFSGCALVFWGKFVRDAWRQPGAAPSTGGQVVLRAGSPELARLRETLAARRTNRAAE